MCSPGSELTASIYHPEEVASDREGPGGSASILRYVEQYGAGTIVLAYPPVATGVIVQVKFKP